MPIFISNQVVITSGDMSLATVTSVSVPNAEGRHIALSATFSGSSPVGTLTLQGSNDGIQYGAIAAALAVSGNSGTVCLNVPNVAFPYINCLYTKTSGTGTITASISVKK